VTVVTISIGVAITPVLARCTIPVGYPWRNREGAYQFPPDGLCHDGRL